MTGWQNRPLDRLYPVLLIDAIVIKVRDSQVANRPVYVAIGVNLDGERDVLGLWLGPTGGEGAKQWMTMLTELRNRGIADALIVCCDGLKGLPDAIRVTWPQATVQTCVVHLVRNSLRYASKKHWSQITRQMRAIYTAATVAAAEDRFAEFAETWRERYPAMIGSWETAWGEFVPFLEFPVELRRIVYTTNAIESLNARFRRAVRHRGHFPTEQAALKGPLPGGHAEAPQPREPDRQDQRVEAHPQRPDRPLRRPRRRHPMTTITPTYTKNRTLPVVLC
jgi:putative transposase